MLKIKLFGRVNCLFFGRNPIAENCSRASLNFQQWGRAFGFIFIFLKEKNKGYRLYPLR